MGVLLTPVVTRLYGPDAYGMVSLYGAVSMNLCVFATMGYHNAIILPKMDHTAQNILYICLILTICTSISGFVAIALAKDIILIKLNAPDLENYLWLIPISIIIHGIFQSFNAWNTRMLRFGNLAVSRVSEIMTKKIYQISAGLCGYASFGSLIIANLTAASVKNIILFKTKGLKFSEINKKVLFKILAISRRYQKFPKYTVWADLFARFPDVIIMFLVFKYFGNNLLGNYALAVFLLAIPEVLISESILQAILPRLAIAKHDGKHLELIEKVYTRMIALAIFPYTVLWLFGDRIFPMIFGDGWEQAGVIAQILVIRQFIGLAFSPFLSLINIIEKQGLHVIRYLGDTLVTAISLTLGIYYNNFYLAMWCLSISGSVLIIILGGYILKIINYPAIKTIKKLVNYLLFAILLTVLLLYIPKSIVHNDYYLIAAITIACTIYYLFIACLDKELTNKIISMFRRSN